MKRSLQICVCQIIYASNPIFGIFLVSINYNKVRTVAKWQINRARYIISVNLVGLILLLKMLINMFIFSSLVLQELTFDYI